MTIFIPMVGGFEPLEDRARVSATRTASFIRQYGPAAFGRDTEIGHVTASGFVLSPCGGKVILLHHRKLGRWLQPGGHCDGSSDVRAVALREVEEETGLTDVRLAANHIFDGDVHEIPARKSEPSHLHYDIRFLFTADPSQPLPGNSESKEIRWVDLDRLHEITTEPSVLVSRRGARKQNGPGL